MAHLFYSDNDPFDNDDVYGVPVDCDGLRAQVVRFAVVTADCRARTRYVRHWMTD